MSVAQRVSKLPDKLAHATPHRLARRRARPVGSCDRLAVHRADDRAAAGDQHLSADLDDPALVHELPRQPAERRRHGCRDSTTTTRILTDPDIWAAMQVDRAFRVLDDRAADAARLRARLADRPQIPRPWLLDHGHPDPDDVVAGGRRQFLDVPLPAADRPLQLRRLVLHRHAAVLLRDDRRR